MNSSGEGSGGEAVKLTELPRPVGWEGPKSPVFPLKKPIYLQKTVKTYGFLPFQGCLPLKFAPCNV